MAEPIKIRFHELLSRLLAGEDLLVGRGVYDIEGNEVRFKTEIHSMAGFAEGSYVPLGMQLIVKAHIGGDPGTVYVNVNTGMGWTPPQRESFRVSRDTWFIIADDPDEAWQFAWENRGDFS